MDQSQSAPERNKEVRHPEERRPLTKDEYYALRQLFGMVSMFSETIEHLEKRSKSVEGGWRDMCMIRSVSVKLMGKLLQTIPEQKLRLMQKELSHTICEVKVNRDVTGNVADTFCYVPDAPLVRTIKRLMGFECFFCDKGKPEWKRCPIRKDIEALYQWDFVSSDDTCPLSGAFAEEGSEEE